MEALRTPIADPSGDLVKARFIEFLQKYSTDAAHNDHHNDHYNDNDEAASASASQHQRLMSDYMFQILSMIQNNKSTVYVDFQHIVAIDAELAEAIELEYFRFEPYLRAAITEIVAIDNRHYVYDVDKGQREFFVSIYNLIGVERIRAMRTDKIGRLMCISGTVTRTSEVRPELLYGSFICTNCGTIHSGVEQQSQYTEPPVCKNPQCSKGRFQLLIDKSVFVDWQRLRVQENADEIPPGSMPRCIDVICRNDIVEMAKAGDKVFFTGMISVGPDTSGLSRAGEATVGGRSFSGRGEQLGDGVQGLKRLGAREMTYKMYFVACSIQQMDHRSGDRRKAAPPPQMVAGLHGDPSATEHEREMAMELTEVEHRDIVAMRNSPHLYTKMVESICPAVFGHTEVKRGILLMLFGGVHKSTKEGISLRGDLNVCIVGDPSCAKSQFLKYIHEFWPRSVYTSGKSSSAAGLTASVVRDNDTGEFCVEAGALMLADNGICCIDEFDKMDIGDQVAIHEAMEQQTISITKAGIQATLNARTSILAAANPVFGRYDRSKTLKANVNISAPIMSRFDLFFVILDECNPLIDEAIARHIIRSHQVSAASNSSSAASASSSSSSAGSRPMAASAPPFTPEQLRRYIRFAKTINPIITKESHKVLVDCYRMLRQNDILGKNNTAYRITVRQLESLVRLSEALARLHLDHKVQPIYVREAYRLLQKSIIFVETEDIELEDIEEGIEESQRRNGQRGRKDRRGSEKPDADEEDDEEAMAAAMAMAIAVEEEAAAAAAAAATADAETHESVGADSDSAAARKRKTADPATAVSAVSAAAAPATEAAEGSLGTTKKAKSYIGAKEYEAATQMLAFRLHSLESAYDSQEGEAYPGCRWADLLHWYLSEIQEELTTVAQFEEKQKTISQIIRRMIKHEGSILVVASKGDQSDAKMPNEEKLLKLHPSYQL